MEIRIPACSAEKNRRTDRSSGESAKARARRRREREDKCISESEAKNMRIMAAVFFCFYLADAASSFIEEEADSVG